MKEELNLQERKFSNEAAALSRLMLPPETSRAAGSVAVSESMSLKMPGNNPCKIRKVGKIHSSPVKSKDEVSLLIDVEELDLLVPSSNEVSLDMSENNHYMKRKRDQIRFDLKEGDNEPCSVLTEVGNSGILCNALASQESVTSTHNCNTSENRLARQIKKLKRSNCKGSENRTSILNYFSRV